MKYTNNYNLKMPEQTDYINVDDFNYNFETIDSQIKAVETSPEEVSKIKEEIITQNSEFEEALTRDNEQFRDELNQNVDTKINSKLDTSALTFVEGGKTYLAKFAVENGIPKIIANEVI